MSHNNSARAVLEQKIIASLPQLSHDELRVFDVQLERMLKIGRKNYGPLVLASEQRDWRKEFSDEFSDALFYMCAMTVAKQDARRERLECFKADRDYKRTNDALNEFAESAKTPIEATFEVRDGQIFELVPPGEVAP